MELNVFNSEMFKKILGTKKQKMKKFKLCASSKHVFFARY
jgi:hypothetical protein